MTSHEPRPSDSEATRDPSPDQFGLRGLLIVTTAVCVIVAAASWAGLRQPVHLLGVGVIVLFCVMTIYLIELIRKLVPERALPIQYLSSRPVDLTSPFKSPPLVGENPFRDPALPVIEPPEPEERSDSTQA